MPKYIDQDALLNKMQERHEDLARDYGDYDNYVMGFGDAIELLENEPAVDVQEVKHAKWVLSERPYRALVCSNCHRGFCHECVPYEYCYVCGSKMDLEDDK